MRSHKIDLFIFEKVYGNSKNEITLIEGETLSSDLEVVNTLNSIFENAIASLLIPQIDVHLIDSVLLK